MCFRISEIDPATFSRQHVDPPTVRVGKRNTRLVLIGTFLCLAMLGAAVWLHATKPPLLVQGKVQATEIRLASRMAGTADTIYVHSGDQVRKGQLLLALENRQPQSELAQARALAEQPKQERIDPVPSVRAEDILAESNLWVEAKCVVGQAERDVRHWREMQTAGIVSAKEVRESEAYYVVAQCSERAAKLSFDLAVARWRRQHTRAVVASPDQGSVEKWEQ